VVKLFNTIQQSQASAAVAEKELKSNRGSGKPTLPAPSFDKKSKRKNKDNQSKRVCDATLCYLIDRLAPALDKDNFMEMIRSGGIVSTT